MQQRTKPAKERPSNDKPAKDLLDSCRRLYSFDDDYIRTLSEMFGHLKDGDHPSLIGDICSSMLDEILRLRRELRRPVNLKKKKKLKVLTNPRKSNRNPWCTPAGSGAKKR